jgi:hypothetical protein
LGPAAAERRSCFAVDLEVPTDIIVSLGCRLDQTLDFGVEIFGDHES